MTAHAQSVLLAMALVALCGCTAPAPQTSPPATVSPVPSSSSAAPTVTSGCAGAAATRIPGDIDGDGRADSVVVSSGLEGGPALEVQNSTAGPQTVLRGDLPIGSARSFSGSPIVIDVNGDGCADVLSAAYQEIDLIPGSTSGLAPAKATSLAGPKGNSSWGNSIAFLSSPRLLAVGVPESPRSPHDGGAVMLYPIGADGSFGEPALIHQDTTDVPGESEAGDEFGWQLAAEGNTLVIGAPGETIGTQRGAGAVTVLRFTGSGLAFNGLRLTQASPGFDAKAEESDGLGNVLAIRGNLVALGVPSESIGAAYETGIVHVVELSSDASPQVERVYSFQQGSAGVPDRNETFDHFGASVAFGSNVGCTPMTVVIGAPGEKINKEKSGAVTLAGLGTACADQWLAAPSPIGAPFVRYLGRRVATLPGGPDVNAPDIVLVADNNARPTGELETGFVAAVRTLGPGNWKSEPLMPRDGYVGYGHFGQELGLAPRS